MCFLILEPGEKKTCDPIYVSHDDLGFATKT